jgi:hypothetical protein
MAPGVVMTEATFRIGQRTSAAPHEARRALGRVGLVGKAVVYGLVGFLALHVALGDSGTDASQTGAVEYVARQPLGRFLLVALTLALFAMALWRLVEVVTGDPVEGDDAKHRVKYAVIGLLYLGLASSALSITLANWGESSGGGGGSGNGQQQAAAHVLDWPGGRWLVALGGALIIAFALYTVKEHVIDKKFTERLDPPDGGWLTPLGQAGYAARAAVYVTLGIFLIQAAIAFDPDKAKGLSQSLHSLAGSWWGQVVLWGVALGLLAFGVFTLAEARYRKAT